MMTRNQLQPAAERGRRASVAVGVIIALVILQLAIVAAVLAGGREQDLSVRRIDTLRAFYAAEGAMSIAVREYARMLDDSGNGTIGSVGATAFATASGSVTATADASTGGLILDAVGTSAESTRRVRTTVKKSTGGITGMVQGLKFESWNLTSGPSSTANVPFTTTPTFSGTIPNVNWASQSSSTVRWVGAPTSNFGIRFSGNIQLSEAGLWSFGINSDDGSILLIDGATVINNDGLHGMANRTGTATLTAGSHTFEIRYFEAGGSNGMIATWKAPSAAAFTTIPSSAFSSTPVTAQLAVQGSVVLTGDGTSSATAIDAFDSTIGPWGGGNVQTSSATVSTNSVAPLAWQMSGNALLQGNAKVGPGGSPGPVIQRTDTSAITGSQTAALSKTALFINTVPTSFVSTFGVVAQNSGTIVISGNTRYTSLTLTGTAAVTVTNSCTIRVDQDFTIQDNATFTILNNAKVTLSLGRRALMYGDAAMNISPGRPGDLRIEMTDTLRELQVSDRSRLVANVFNPLGSLYVYPNSNTTGFFSGTFAGNSVQTLDKARIHLDVAASAGGATSVVTVITDWLEAP